MLVNKLIEESRRAKGMTQKALAKKLNFRTSQFVSNWDRNVCQVPSRHFKQIAEILHIPIDSLINLAAQDLREKLMADHGVTLLSTPRYSGDGAGL